MSIKIAKSAPAPAPSKLAKSGPPIVAQQQPKPTISKTTTNGMTTSVTLTEADGTSAFATYTLGPRDDIYSTLAIINTDRVLAGLHPISIDDIGR